MTISLATGSYGQSGGGGEPSKPTPNFGANGGQICVPIRMHIVPECCVARQSKHLLSDNSFIVLESENLQAKYTTFPTEQLRATTANEVKRLYPSSIRYGRLF